MERNSAVLQVAKDVQHHEHICVAREGNSCSDMFSVVSESLKGKHLYINT